MVTGKRGLDALSGGLNRGLVETVVDGAKRDLGEFVALLLLQGRIRNPEPC